jgi:hypothetical protein
MTQDQCLLTPSHFTHLGVCYVGSNASVTLSDPNHPQATNWAVAPEPSTTALFMAALLIAALSRIGKHYRV